MEFSRSKMETQSPHNPGSGNRIAHKLFSSNPTQWVLTAHNGLPRRRIRYQLFRLLKQ